MKVYHQFNYGNLRSFVVTTIDSVFGGISTFLDMVDEGLPCKYDIIYSNDEFYIINRKTGEYINWYKYTHVGRDIHMNFTPNRLKKFLKELKEEWEEYYNENNN